MYRRTSFPIRFDLRQAVRLVASGAALLFPHISCAQSPPPAAMASDASSDDCLSELVRGGVTLQAPKPSEDVVWPVQIDRKLGPLRLVPRGPYPALMDCSLALALQRAAPVFIAVGLNELQFSAAYDHRTRRGSTQLSSHSFGRAIDVHVFDGVAGKHDVAEDFERGVGTWLGISPHDGALAECIGSPLTDRGRALRTLVCRLKLETELRIIVTPDDNDDHRDHIHLEYAPPYVPRTRVQTLTKKPTPPTIKKAAAKKVPKRTAKKRSRPRGGARDR